VLTLGLGTVLDLLLK